MAVAWIVAQGILGNTSDGAVAPLFLWVYGWVGVALVSALLGPVWHFLDPFSTLHDLGAGLLRRLGVGAWSPAAYPERLGRWPATVGFVGFVWLELVDAGGGPVDPVRRPRRLHRVHARDDGPVRPRHVALERRDLLASGSASSGGSPPTSAWTRTAGSGAARSRAGCSSRAGPCADAALAALGVGSILFDGLSQTQPFFDLFGAPGDARGDRAARSRGWGSWWSRRSCSTRVVGIAATGAGLLPIAVGYLIAHYLTYLLIDGQNILVAISDPFQQGWDLFGTAFHEAYGHVAAARPRLDRCSWRPSSAGTCSAPGAGT